MHSDGVFGFYMEAPEMIPSIETIVEDLAAGKITKSQAVTWLHAHAEGAVNELRDQFASFFAPALIGRNTGCGTSWDHVAIEAYRAADAMIKFRKATK